MKVHDKNRRNTYNADPLPTLVLCHPSFVASTKSLAEFLSVGKRVPPAGGVVVRAGGANTIPRGTKSNIIYPIVEGQGIRSRVKGREYVVIARKDS